MTDPIETIVPAGTDPVVETAGAEPVERIVLPADHPLVITLAKQKQDLKDERARIAALSEKARRMDEIDEANKSELDRERELRITAETQVAESRLEADRNAVALAKGLTPTQAKRLMGANREELEADADELLVDLKASRPSAVASAEGQGKQGEAVGQSKQITSREELQKMSPAQIVQAQQEGRLDGLLQGQP